MKFIGTGELLVICALFAGFTGLIVWTVRRKRPPKDLTGTRHSAAVPDLSMAHAWFCGVIPIVAIGTIMANLSKPYRKRASQAFAIGCLGPVLYYLFLWMLFGAIGENEDLKGVFGLLGLVVFLVLPFFILSLVRGSPQPKTIGNCGLVTSGSPADAVSERDADGDARRAESAAVNELAMTAARSETRKPSVTPSLCGECQHFRKTGLLDRFKGRCEFYEFESFANWPCRWVGEARVNAQPPVSEEQGNAEDSRSPKGTESDGRTGAALRKVKVRTLLIAALLLVLLGAGFVVVRNTALRMAARSGNATAVTLLLALGADVNAEDEHGVSALKWAAFHGHTSTVQALLSKGALVERDSSGGVTVNGTLWVAAEKGHTDVLLALLSKVKKPAAAAGICLWPAVGEGHAATVRALLAAGGDSFVNTRMGNESLVAVATKAGRSDIVQLLKEAGARE